MPVRHIALIVEVEVDRQQSAELDERPYLVRGQIQEHLQLMYPTQQVVVSGFQVMDGPNPTHVLIDKHSALAKNMAKHGHVPDELFPEDEPLDAALRQERETRRGTLVENGVIMSQPQGRHSTRPIDVGEIKQSKDGKTLTVQASEEFVAAVSGQGRPPKGGSGQSQSPEELPRPDRPDNVTSIGKAREKRRWKGKR